MGRRWAGASDIPVKVRVCFVEQTEFVGLGPRRERKQEPKRNPTQGARKPPWGGGFRPIPFDFELKFHLLPFLPSTKLE